ncbi:DMT family transporter [Oceanobacillus sp. CAU 1775]
MVKIYLLLLFVMMLWGFNLSALKVLVTNIDPVLLTAVRIAVAGVSVIIITFFLGIFRFPTKKEFKTILYISIFNVMFHHVLLAQGLTTTSGVNAGLILGAAPLVTMMLSIIILKDYLSRLRVLGFILGFTGIIITTFVGSGGMSSIAIGDVYIGLAVLTQAFSFILISKLNPSFDPRLLTGFMLLVGSIAIFIYSLITDVNFGQLSTLFDWKLGSLFLFSAVLCTAFGHMVYNFSVKEIGPAESAVFINLNTFFGLLGVAIFLGEPILFNHIIGLALILIGVFVGTGALEYLLKKRKLTN